MDRELLGAKGFPVVADSLGKQSEGTDLSWAQGDTNWSYRKKMLWGKETGRVEVTFTSKLGSRRRQEGLAAPAPAYWPVSWDDCQVEPGRGWCQPLWNPRLGWASFTNSQGPLSSVHEVRTQPVSLLLNSGSWRGL